MASRIQFRTSEKEYELIKRHAEAAGFPMVSQFVKELALAYPNPLHEAENEFSFAEIYADVLTAVQEKIARVMEDPMENRRFVLREITPGWHRIPQHETRSDGTVPKTLRASIGKHFFSEVTNDRIEHVRYTNKVDTYGTAIYEVEVSDESK